MRVGMDEPDSRDRSCPLQNNSFIFYIFFDSKSNTKKFHGSKKKFKEKERKKEIRKSPPPRFICIDILTTTVTTRDIKIDYCL